jgi:hypothetical protein
MGKKASVLNGLEKLTQDEESLQKLKDLNIQFLQKMSLDQFREYVKINITAMDAMDVRVLEKMENKHTHLIKRVGIE